MKWKLPTILISSLVILLSSSTTAQAARGNQGFMDPNILKELLPKVSYTADRSMTMQGQTITSKVYYAPQMERNEMSFGGFTSVSVTRYDRELIWTTTPMGGVSEISFAELQKAEKSNDAETTLEEDGHDTIDGQKVNIYTYTRVDSKGARVDGRFFLTEDNIPLRNEMTYTESKGKEPMQMVMQLRNIKRGEQAATLFEKPQSVGLSGGLKNLFKKN
jgi:hypothetical protein